MAWQNTLKNLYELRWLDNKTKQKQHMWRCSVWDQNNTTDNAKNNLPQKMMHWKPVINILVLAHGKIVKAQQMSLSGSYWEMQDHLHNDDCPKKIGQLLYLFGWAVQLPSPPLILFSDYTATRCYEKCVFSARSLFFYRVHFDRLKRCLFFVFF